MSDALTVPSAEPVASPSPAADVADTWVAVIERAARDPTVDVDKLDRLLQMREREHARIAERAFNEALAAAQAEMDAVRADADNSQTRSRYASYAALDRAVRPIYTRHGFGLTFDTGDAPGAEQARIVCEVSHIGGHTRRYHLDMPVDGKGARGGDVMTKTHAMGSGITYGRRYLLGMVFNLVTAKDDDGNAAGGLRRRDATPVFDRLLAELRAIRSMQELDAWGNSIGVTVATLSADLQRILRLNYADKLKALRASPEAREPEVAVPINQESSRPRTVMPAPKVRLKAGGIAARDVCSLCQVCARAAERSS